MYQLVIYLSIALELIRKLCEALLLLIAEGLDEKLIITGNLLFDLAVELSAIPAARPLLQVHLVAGVYSIWILTETHIAVMRLVQKKESEHRQKYEQVEKELGRARQNETPGIGPEDRTDASFVLKLDTV